MSFYEDPSFFILLAAAIVPAAVLGCTGRRIKPWGLVVSVLFLVGLFMGSWEGLLLVACYVPLTFLVSRLVLARVRSGRPLTAATRLVSLACVIGPLVIYKVSTAAGSGILGFVGISYITFKTTQVLLEIEDGLIESLSFIDYLYFLVFFPVFTSGPIDRSRRFMADANRTLDRPHYLDLLGRGIVFLLIGAASQIVIATIFKQWYKPVAFDMTQDVWSQLVSFVQVSYAYGLYLYFDFAGYSLMAQGASMCLGIETPANFRLPFLSHSLEEFWDRWHITLSHWLRDYVFMRMERSLTRHRIPKKRDARAAVGLVADMCLMGAWHGLTPQYLLYGLYHGVLLAIEQIMTHRWRFFRAHRNDVGMKVVMWFITLNLVMFGFSIFSGQLFTFIGGIHG
ncbi:MAG: D-alanyl-lipoteichoic acid biosynthesis protein DltB [Atopobiaceae bacterium]|nr:D-alanyl-lipoteichoic acid biosynthesis protein DltB [Atopobiaceae bacterium]MCI2173076.1 D-alanyl-lipoteichoic acid biosynthesis protein DltB [Atopobiaceae bacterium]MCI2208169.1 D-alanyl-lipoteichoic acid biosynthesis protein DltB [Atopobiaceae bacterium]